MTSTEKLIADLGMLAAHHEAAHKLATGLRERLEAEIQVSTSPLVGLTRAQLDLMAAQFEASRTAKSHRPCKK